jgi:nucleoside 2-deoxyribosyltransferase
MRPRLRVYVAGPMLGSGNPYVNVSRGLDVAVILLERGLAPYMPQLTAVLEMTKGMQERETWMELDRAYLVVCDAVLRLPGVSPGADQECDWAREQGIPVFYSLDTLFAWEGTRR